MRTLLVEIGNTSVRCAMPAKGGLRLVRRLETGALTMAALQAVLRRNGAQRVAVCSVVPAATAAVRAAAGSLPCFVASANCELGFRLASDLPQPARIGPDRLLGVAGALSLGARGPLLVIDAGTACTFNVLDARGVFRGGAIAPGLAAFTAYLAERTAKLPHVTLTEVARAGAIGRETRSAIAAGCRHGFIGQARELVHEMTGALGMRRLSLWVTGGAAPLLAPALSARAEPFLVLRGLAAVSGA